MARSPWLALFGVTAAIIFLAPSGALAGPRLSLLGLSNVTQLEVSQAGLTSKTDGLLGFGGGALLEFPLSGVVGVETGAIYALRQFGSASLETRLQQVQLPVTVKLWLGNLIYLNAGAYLGMGLGEMKSTSSDGAVSSYGFSDYTLKKTDIGVLAGLGANLQLSSSTSLRLGAQFLQSQVNASSDSAATRKFTEIQIIAGFSFGGGRSFF